MIFGCVSTSRSLLPLTSRFQSLKRVAAIAGLVELVALDHGAHGAVDDEDALCGRRLERFPTRDLLHVHLLLIGLTSAAALRCSSGAALSGRSPSRWQIA